MESENKELARMCREKAIELDDYKQQTMQLINQNNAEKEKFLNLQQELTIAQNDRINLQEELTKTLLLLETKSYPIEAGSEASEIKKRLEKRSAQLKEAREAFGLLVFSWIKPFL